MVVMPSSRSRHMVASRTVGIGAHYGPSRGPALLDLTLDPFACRDGEYDRRWANARDRTVNVRRGKALAASRASACQQPRQPWQKRRPWNGDSAKYLCPKAP